MSKKNEKAAAAPETRVQPYLIVGIKGSNSGAKVAIEDIQAGKDLLKEIQVAANKKNVFYDEKRGLLFAGAEISHAFLTFEQVK